MRVVKNVIFMDINFGIVKVKVDFYLDIGLIVFVNFIMFIFGILMFDVIKKFGEVYFYVYWIDVEMFDGEKVGMKIKGEFEEWFKKIFW